MHRLAMGLRMKQIILCLVLSCEVGSHYIHLVSWNNSHPFQWLECVPWPWFVTTDYYPWNSCQLTTDRVVFMGPCTETAIIALLPCYSRMYMVLSTYVLDFARYVYNSPFFWWGHNAASPRNCDIKTHILVIRDVIIPARGQRREYHLTRTDCPFVGVAIDSEVGGPMNGLNDLEELGLLC